MEKSGSDDPILPFNDSMERTSIFVPANMKHLLSMMAMKQDVGEATLIRNLVLQGLARYIEEVEKSDGGQFDAIRAGKDPLHPAADTEANSAFVKALYERFAAQDAKFPERVQLHHRRRKAAV